MTPAAWADEPATDSVVRTFAGVIYGELSPRTPSDVMAKIAGMIARQGYSADELAYCAARLPFDEKTAESMQYKTPNPYWLLPHVERIIRESRRLRRQLAEGLLSEWDIGKIVAAHPEIERTDFQRGGFTADDQPLYRYAPGIAASDEARSTAKLYGRANG